MEKKATQVMIENQEQDRLAWRDRNISVASAARAITEASDIEFEDNKLRQAVHEIAIRAAYLAIQGDREMHHHEMKSLDKAMGLHLQELSTRPQSQIIFPMESELWPLPKPDAP